MTGAGGSGRETGVATASIGPADRKEADGWNGTKLCLWAGREIAVGRPVRERRAMNRITAGHFVSPINPVVPENCAAISDIFSVQPKQDRRLSKSKPGERKTKSAPFMTVRLKNNSATEQERSLNAVLYGRISRIYVLIIIHSRACLATDCGRSWHSEILAQ
ncbi:hypothetical protein [Methylobacterium sp. ARG-1]|uniref:hypothetical protein n=1 Tax=Methylobacterium sp. ARG-1 TaxID=1692501 RepID=UPI0011875AF5|nr:hypothetical protein [Methylobacterium sp. ARG-1]